MNKKYIYSKLIAGILGTALLTSCSSNPVPQSNNTSSAATGIVSGENSNADKNSGKASISSVTYDEDDIYTDWKNQNPNYIELIGTKININGSGAAVSDSKVTINKAGVYVVSGKLDNGQIIVDVQDKGTVRLVLNGAEISSSDNAPVYVMNAGKVIISLPEGTNNTLSDGKKYVLLDAASDEPNSAIFSKDDMTINGTGQLNINANFNNGITSKDDLKIIGGVININAVDDGILGRDLVAVKAGTITIKAGGDGIKTTNGTDTAKGLVALQGGNFTLTSGADAIQSSTLVVITDGKYTITTGGGSVNSSAKADNSKDNPWGRQQSNTPVSGSNSDTRSAKGIKAADVSISGGTFKMDTSDDSIHSNNSAAISGGDFSIASGDDGIHADASITISNGKINITKSYEGIESALVSISGGDINVVSSDDGINIAGGNDSSSVQGRPGQNSFKSSGNNKLDISGGFITVDALGDGLDSNGSVYMSGGTVIVSGPTANNNGALDYDGVFEVTGGLLAAAGSSGMAQAPSEQSVQNSIAMSFPSVQKAGTIVNLQDSKGNTIVTFEPNKNYQTVVISSPEIKKDSSYTLYSGGASTGNVTGGLYKGGNYQGGTKAVTFTVTNSVTWLNESGVTTGARQNPGGMGPGGMGPGNGGNQGRPGKGGF